MDIEILAKEHIYMMHEEAIEEFGGEKGVYNYTDGKIQSILAQQTPYFGYDKYPNVFQKAAMLMYFFTKGHCFADGNKRVGLNSAIVFLMINGFEPVMKNKEAYDKTMEIAKDNSHNKDIDSYIYNLALWLKDRFIELGT